MFYSLFYSCRFVICTFGANTTLHHHSFACYLFAKLQKNYKLSGSVSRNICKYSLLLGDVARYILWKYVYFIYLFFLFILLRAVFPAENNLQTKIFLKIMRCVCTPLLHLDSTIVIHGILESVISTSFSTISPLHHSLISDWNWKKKKKRFQIVPVLVLFALQNPEWSTTVCFSSLK